MSAPDLTTEPAVPPPDDPGRGLPVADPAPAPRGLGALGWARWAWTQLTSMRTALLLLMLLAVAAVPGSVFPQRRIDPSAVQAYLTEHTVAGPWLDRFGFFDVFTSPWFSAVYLLLFVSLVGCVVPRCRVHWRNVRSAPPRTPSVLARMPEHRRVILDADPEQVLAAARTVLRRSRFRVAAHEATPARGRVAAAGASLSAEKGYSAETGNLTFHLALLGLLCAVAAGSFWSWTGQVLVAEGRTFTNTPVRYNSLQAGTRVDTGNLPPFSFTLDKLVANFDASTTDNNFGNPTGFDATLTVRDAPDAAPRTVAVKVNDPLQVDGTSVYLSGNGYAPQVVVKDGQGNVAYAGAVPFLPQDSNYTSLGVIKVPDAKPRQLGLRGFFLPTGVIDPAVGPVSIFPDARAPRLVLTGWVSRPGRDGLGMDGGVPQSVFVLDTRDMTQLRTANGDLLRMFLAPGQTQTLPDGAGSVTFTGWVRYGSFDLRHDPSKTPALVFAVLAIAGVTSSLFVRRRRAWVRATPDGQGRTVVEVAGLARGEDGGLAAVVDRIRDDVVRAVGGPAASDVPAGQDPAVPDEE